MRNVTLYQKQTIIKGGLKDNQICGEALFSTGFKDPTFEDNLLKIKKRIAFS
jgi:hypothetical protein